MTPKETKRILLALIPLGVLIGLLSLDIAIFGTDSILGWKIRRKQWPAEAVAAGKAPPPSSSPAPFHPASHLPADSLQPSHTQSLTKSLLEGLQKKQATFQAGFYKQLTFNYLQNRGWKVARVVLILVYPIAIT